MRWFGFVLFGFSLIVGELFAACGRVHRLPPVGEAPQSSCPAASADASAQCQSDTEGGEIDPALAAQVRAYLKGKSVAILRAGSRVGCVTDIGPPCQGMVATGSGMWTPLSADTQCTLTSGAGKLRFLATNSQQTVLLDVSVTQPKSFFPPPNEIGDSSAQFVIVSNCAL